MTRSPIRWTERARTVAVVIATAAFFLLLCAFTLMTTGSPR